MLAMAFVAELFTRERIFHLSAQYGQHRATVRALVTFGHRNAKAKEKLL